MRSVACLAACLIVLAASVLSADERDTLIQARTLYNDGKYAAAVTAADKARLAPAQADSADLIAARAYLEQFRQNAMPTDLSSARQRLRRINPSRFSPSERLEFIVGLGEALYCDGTYGAAAAVFQSVLDEAAGLVGESRERVLDWWANALDREAWPRPDIERQGVYQRIRDTMGRELALRPTSATASYWLAASARAQGDLQGAWDAATAAWVRAPLTPDRGASLRADLDRLMDRAIIPERARATAQTPDTVRAEWEQFKMKW